MRVLIVLLFGVAVAQAQDLPWSFEQRLSAVEIRVADAIQRIERLEGNRSVRVLVDGRWYIRDRDGIIRECAECSQPIEQKVIRVPVADPVVYVPIVEPITTITTIPIAVTPVKTVRRVGLLGMRTEEVHSDGTIVRRGPLGAIRSIERAPVAVVTPVVAPAFVVPLR